MNNKLVNVRIVYYDCDEYLLVRDLLDEIELNEWINVFGF